MTMGYCYSSHNSLYSVISFYKLVLSSPGKMDNGLPHLAHMRLFFPISKAKTSSENLIRECSIYKPKLNIAMCQTTQCDKTEH